MTITEIKKSAKIKLKGNYLKCTSCSLLYFIIVALLTILLDLIGVKLQNHTIPLLIIQALFSLVISVLSYGLIVNIIKILNGETNAVTKFIDISILNFGKFVKIILQIIFRTLIPIIICLLCYFYFFGTLVAYGYSQNFYCFYANLLPVAAIVFIASVIVLIYFLLKYVLSKYVYNENPTLNSKDIVKKSNELMKGKKVNYCLLLLSFIGWLLIIAIIMSILTYFIESNYLVPLMILFYSLIKPYITTSELLFFESLGDENKESDERIRFYFIIILEKYILFLEKTIPLLFLYRKGNLFFNFLLSIHRKYILL